MRQRIKEHTYTATTSCFCAYVINPFMHDIFTFGFRRLMNQAENVIIG